MPSHARLRFPAFGHDAEMRGATSGLGADKIPEFKKQD